MNNVKYYIHMALFSLAYMLISSTVIQTFLLELGVGEQVVSVYMSATQVVQVQIMLFASGMMDRIKKPVKVYVISVLVQFVLLVVVLVFCNVKAEPAFAFAVIFAVSVLTFVFYEFKTGKKINLFRYRPFQVLWLNTLGAPFTLVLAGMCQLVSGIVYFVYSRKVGLKNE